MALPPPLFGSKLSEWINSPQPKREYIAEGFINTKSCILVAADSGLGKSTVSLQVALQLSCGMPLFGALDVKKSYRCYYIQKERPREEIGERIEAMQKAIPQWNPDHFFLDDQLQHLNLSRESSWQPIIDRILPYTPDVIFIDPIYAGTPGLSKDEVASAFTTFLTLLEQQTGATVWLNHHTTKATYSSDGKKIEKEDPIYGSTWIKAHLTAAYHLTACKDGVLLAKKKDSHLNLLTSIELEFDPETFISTAKGEWGSGLDRLALFINHAEKSKLTFSMEDIKSQTDLSRTSVLRYFGTGQFKGRIHNLSTNGKRGLYSVIKVDN